MSSAAQVLVVTVGPYTLAMDAGDVQAVSHGGAAETYETQETVARRALGIDDAAPRKSRLLLVNSRPPRPLRVDAVHGLRDLQAMAVQRLPLLMQGNPRTPWLLGLGECDGCLLLLVDAKLLEGATA